jgi:hypothetical protein
VLCACTCGVGKLNKAKVGLHFILGDLTNIIRIAREESLFKHLC